MDTIEHYLSKQSFDEIPTQLRELLMEGSTADASDAEVAICVAYNMNKGKTEKAALAATGVDAATWAKIKKKKAVVKVGKKVANSLKNIGAKLQWSGKSSADTHYEKGSNKTAKTDLYGNDSNRLSLKKAASSGAGAQLMSAYTGESAGVFEYAMKHLKAAEGDVISEAEKKEVFDMLENEMAQTARSDMNVEIATGRRDFKAWVLSDSGRFAEVKKQAPDATDTEIEKHIKAELAVANAISTADAPKLEGNYIKGVKPLTKSDVEKMRSSYIESDMEIGDVKVSQDNLDKAKVPEDLLTKGKLREQIMDVIDVCLDAESWKNRLTTILETNPTLKRWIVYEAASGLGKFTGKAAAGSDYTGPESAVANKILVFDDNGLKKVHWLYKWSKTNAGLCDKVSISYKGSGRRRYIKFGLASEGVGDDSQLLTESINFDGIVDEEYSKFEKEIKQLALNEGVVWDKIKSGFSSAATWVSDAYEKIKELVVNFYEGVIKKFFVGLWELLKEGLDAGLVALGLKIEGKCSIKTPKW